jgi:hypothetical protein
MLWARARAIGAMLVLGVLATAAAGRFWPGAPNTRTELATPKEKE